ncbi:neurotrypsin isoform X2 [Patella vulgata]|nr:neurotrypsin isoform X2 [Patella vulgata]
MGLGEGGRLLPVTAFRYLKVSLDKDIFNTTFNCQGTEARLRDCISENKASCPSTDVAAVVCSVPPTSTVDGETRIGDDEQVEVFYHDYWGTVCPRHWDDNAAKVMCKDLAQHAKASVIAVGDLKPRWVFDVNCTGDEDKLDSCQITRDDPNFECDTIDQAVAYCYNNTLDFRLTGGGRNYGYVQLTHNGVTGYLQGTDLARAACNTFGFNGGIAHDMPQLSTRYWWFANRNEQFLGFPLLKVNNLQPRETGSKQEYLSVFCYENVRLGSIGYGIVLEMKYRKYYAYCADGFAQKEGDAVCRQLGYPKATKITVGTSKVEISVIGFLDFTCPEGANSTKECTSTFNQSGGGCVSGRAYVHCIPDDSNGGSNGLEITACVTITALFLVHVILSAF